MDGSLWLSGLIPLEFLAIHGGPFMIGVVAAKLETCLGRVCQWIVFLWFASFYSLFAGQLGGVSTVVMFYAMMLSTYLGFLLNLNAPDRLRQLFLRWIVSFFLFIIPALTIEGTGKMSNWGKGHPSLLLFGAIYFGAMAVVELIGFYDLNIWERMGGKAKTPPTVEAVSEKKICPACGHREKPEVKGAEVGGQVGCLTTTVGALVVVFWMWKSGELRSKHVFEDVVMWWGIIGFGASAAGLYIGELIAGIRGTAPDPPEGGWCQCSSG